MLPYYRTVSESGIDEVIIKKSRFIGQSIAVYSEDEANAFVESVRKTHPTAAHHCYAYCIGDQNQIQKQSDNGEPSGTAGKPILEVIKNQQLQYTLVVVTRYFGGVKLGASGLIRAYTDGAIIGIDAARPVYQVQHCRMRVTIDYTWQGKIEHQLRQHAYEIETIDFSDKVVFVCLPLLCEKERFTAAITDWTNGQGIVEEGEVFYVPHPSLPTAFAD